jgi:hypothetical protein
MLPATQPGKLRICTRPIFFEAKEKNYVVERIQSIFLKGINDTDANLITKTAGKFLTFLKP